MKNLGIKPFAALIQSLIVMSKYDRNNTQQPDRYTILAGELCRKYQLNPRLSQITTANVWQEFQKIKDETTRHEFIRLLLEVSINKEYREAETEKYLYLSRLLVALDR